jgi:hypothetical protein
MAEEIPCTACSWTVKRQNASSYHSNVTLSYSASDRTVWSLGSKYMLKDRSIEPPNFEAQNIQFLTERTTIPVPKIVLAEEDNDNRYLYLQNAYPATASATSGGPYQQTTRRRLQNKQRII